jgi:hypothetical protein
MKNFKEQACIAVTDSHTTHNVYVQMGRLELRRGEMHFFLKPGEELLAGGVMDVIVLGPDEALLLRANQVCYA